ncbi:MAG: Rne/Rng family ribonuclease [Halanaerobiaceae bacterium]|nr:Rne/Rng family ribonuclease [Halanaerobiaceae bacterium]
MGRQIIINSGIREKRAAVLEEGQIEDVFIEQDIYDQIAGNIYRGKVKDVLPGMQAAFIDIGIERNAFLHINDLYPLLDDEKRELWKNNKFAIQEILKPGQEIMVQIIKESIGSKGPKATCKVSIPGRYFVLMPFETRISISRKITDVQEREKLKAIANELTENQYGVIIRTNSAGKEKDELKKDLDYLIQIWKSVLNDYQGLKAPSLVYQHAGLIIQVVRDYISADIEKVVIDDEKEYEYIVNILEKLAPNLKNRVFLYEGDIPLFVNYNIEKELAKVLNRKVWLNSGGYIIIDKTEALVSIDVNTGKYTGKKNLQETVFRTNLEAAKEIARQLRIRDIGGIIIIDFIDMELKEHQDKVLEVLERELSKDKTRTALLGLTKLGLVEMTRKKVREGFSELIQKECPYCHGSGMVITESSMALKIIRDLTELIAREKFSAVLLEVHPRVAAVLIGAGGDKLKELEEELNLDIYISGNDELHIEEYNIINRGSKEELIKLALPVREGEEYELLIEDRQLNNPDFGVSRINGYIILIEGAGNKVGKILKVRITEISRTYARAEIIG